MTDFIKYVRSTPNYPIPEILFRDLTPLLNDQIVFQRLIDLLRDNYRRERIDKIVGVGTAGTVIGSALAYAIGCGFTSFFKNRMLPKGSQSTHFTTQFSVGSLSAYPDTIKSGERILIQGDVLASGATPVAAIRLVEENGGKIVRLSFVAELTYLPGRKNLQPYGVDSIFTFRDQKPFF